jgi:plasmid stability protein
MPEQGSIGKTGKLKKINHSIHYSAKLAILLGTLPILLQIFTSLTVSAQQTTNFPPEVKQAFESAMIEVGDLSSQVSWLATYGEITEWETVNVEWETDGPSWRESDSGAELMIIFYDDYNQRVNVDLNYLYYLDEPDSLLQSGFQRTNILPTENAYTKSYYDPGSGKYVAKIIFYKNEWTSVYVDVMLLAPEPAEAEAIRLAALLWSRIPENLPSPNAGNNNTTDLEVDTGEGQMGSTLAPPDDSLITYPPDSISKNISNGALFFATGFVALITLLSSLSIISATGTTSAEALDEIKAFFGSGKKTTQGLSEQTRDLQEILKSPHLHDQVTDAKGKKWVYYHRPGDKAGDGWTSPEEYSQTLSQEGENKIWTDRYGWQTREKLTRSEEMAEKFAADNREATAKFNEELKTPLPAELPQTELSSYLSLQEREQFAAVVKEARQQFEQETDDILKELVASERRQKESVARSGKLGQEIDLEGKKATFALKLAENTEKLRQEGYWIRNPYNSYTLQIKNLLVSPKDPKGLQCGDLVKLKIEEVSEMATEKFGEGVIVDIVDVEERSTAAPQGFVDSLDSVVPYNHRAIRVITPDGESFIVDYWQALHHKDSTIGLMRAEKTFIEGWNGSLGGDSVFEGNLHVYQGAQYELPALIKQHGQEQGLAIWQSETESIIHEANLPPDLKEQNLQRLQTLVNYLSNEGEKIGF